MMKKIVLLVVSLVWITGSCFAQSAANRTWKTKVSDALALLPATEEGEYNRLMGDLVSTGSDGINLLINMFDNTNNTPVTYALGGWAMYVSGGDREQERKQFAEGVARGLEKSNNPDVSAFYITLLTQCGKAECVDVLAQRIGDARLGGPALRALTANRTSEAKAAIAKAVTTTTGDKSALAEAVGAAGVDTEGIEPMLLSWIGDDVNVNKSVYYALSKIGTTASLPALRTAATKAGYNSEPTNATDAYIHLVKKLKADGEDKIATAEANTTLKKACANGAEQTRIAATEILLPLQKSPADYALKAMKDPARAYRNGVLEFVQPYADEAFYVALAESMEKLKEDQAKIDIIHHLGKKQVATTLPLIMPYMKASDGELSDAAMWAATRIGGAGVPEALGEVILSASDEANDQASANTALACLLAYKGDVNGVAAKLVQTGNDARGLVILGARRAKNQANVVFEATQNPDTIIATTAYLALSSVVTPNDLGRLSQMLEKQTSINQHYTVRIQEALVAAIQQMPLAEASEREIKEAVQKHMAKSGAKQSLYYAVLANAKLPGAMEYIAEGFRNGSKDDKDNALYALFFMGMEAGDKLLEIAAGSDSEYAVQSLEAYIKGVNRINQTPENKVLMLTQALEIASTNKALPQDVVARLKTIALNEVENNQTFQGLILAGKYMDDSNESVRQAAVSAVIRTALAHKELYGSAVVDLLNRAREINKDKDSSYQREEIQKHLASLPGSGGFVSMFNGVDLTGWKGLVENPVARAQMKPAELAKKQIPADEAMHRDWKVNNGLLEFAGHGYDNICTEKLYGDFEMYLDWKLYAEGTEADAGIYLRGTPQVQMWDTSRRNVGAEVGSGGLYNNQTNPSKPSHVADNKLGAWNTFYIKMVGDRVTVKLNGDTVVNNVILENFWDHSQPIFPIEQIELQAHGTRVAYRNLYINALPQVQPVTLSKEEQAEGFKLLYDGTNMHEWRGNTRDYISEDGAIVLYPGNGGGGNLYTKEEYKDFVYRFDFMLTEGANNGVGIRTPLDGDAAYVGMEIQLLDNEAPIYSQLEEYQYHGSVYGVIAAKRGFLKPVGEWNSEEIRIKGNDIRVTLNGEVILEGNLAEASKNGTLDHKDHPGLKNEKGHIGFLGHGSIVKFKNIRIKPL